MAASQDSRLFPTVALIGKCSSLYMSEWLHRIVGKFVGTYYLCTYIHG